MSISLRQALTGREFFPRLIAAPFHHGLVVVCLVAAGLSVIGALASLMRGGRYVPSEPPAGGDPAPAPPAPASDSRLVSTTR